VVGPDDLDYGREGSGWHIVLKIDPVKTRTSGLLKQLEPIRLRASIPPPLSYGPTGRDVVTASRVRETRELGRFEMVDPDFDERADAVMMSDLRR
jgi:hypothetical protein